MKTIELQIPDGKKAEWVNGVLTLVDEEVKDNRPVTERIKTFEDAYNELGEEHHAARDYDAILAHTDPSDDIIAYLKLRIIAAALNEGWQPKFTTDEHRYFPYFYLYAQEEINEMDDEKKSRVVYRSGSNANAFSVVAFSFASSDDSDALMSVGSRLSFKTLELAKYAGEQFIEIWSDYVFKGE